MQSADSLPGPEAGEGFPRFPVKWENFAEDKDPGWHLSEKGHLVFVSMEENPNYMPSKKLNSDS